MILPAFSEFISNNTLSESYYQTKVDTFSEHISNITDTFRELLPNNSTHFSRHQTIATFSEGYWQNNTTLFS